MRKLVPVAIVLLLSVAPVVLARNAYVRLSTGIAISEQTVVADRNCSATNPPALFGCVAGSDGRSLAARGDFGRSALFEAAAGSRIGDRMRVEVAVGVRPHTDLRANANFPGVAGAQPVDASGRSASALIVAIFDAGDASWRVRPFVLAGAGVARNTTGYVVYSFPGIAPDAVTITRGGTHTNLAWTAGAGVAVPLSRSLALDLTLRRSDSGEMRTAGGPATIVRPTRRLTIDIAGTRAPLRTTEALMSLRWRM